MLTKLFDGITTWSVRLRWLTLLLTLAVLAAGGWAYTQLNQELVPPVEFPQTFVFTQWPDAEDTQDVLDNVTIPLETAMQEIDGVVNVETTTNSAFAITIVRNEFGLNQEQVAEDIQEAIDSLALPETAAPDVLTFSLADLPVIAASVSSDQMTLAELKEDINSNLAPKLEAVADVARVDIEGGQELPEKVEAEIETEAEEPEPTPTSEPAAETETSNLSLPLRLGLRAYGIDVETVNEITPEYTRILIYQGGVLAMEALNLLTPDNLRNAQPPSLAYLPSDYTDDLEPELADELNELSADYGGIGQFNIDEAQAAKDEDLDILTGYPVEFGTIDTIDLEEAEAAAAEAEMANDSQPESSETMSGEADSSSNSDMANEMTDVEPIELPASWQQAGQMQSISLETTADITPELMQGFSQAPAAMIAPLFTDLTPDMLAAIDPEAVALIPEGMLPAEMEEAVAIEPVELPASWQQAGQMQNISLETTADITPELMQGFSQVPAAMVAPLFADLTPDMIAAIDPEALAAVPEGMLPEMAAADDGMMMGNGDMMMDENGVRLPAAWRVASRALELDMFYAADLMPEAVDAVELVNPDLLTQISPAMLMEMSREAIAALPADIIESQDDDTITALIDAGKYEELVDVDPKALSPILAGNGEIISEAMGQEIRLDTTNDLTPELVRTFAGFGGMADQLFSLLTPENLREMNPEALALLPASYVETLDPAEKVYLDGLAVEYGGIGQLLVTEAEEAAAMAAASPPMTGVWLELDEDGNEPQFTTAAAIIANNFAPSGADFINFLPDSPRIPDVTPWIEALTPEIIDYMIENDAKAADGFLMTLQDRIYAFMLPETVQHIKDTYADELTDDRNAYIDDVLSGGVEVFLPETAVTRNAGNPALIINVYKDGDANTVNVSHDVFDVMAAYADANPGTEVVYAFEQASFIEESINGVAQEGLLGAIFAILVILVFLSGRINGKYRLSWRATLITALSIPASILFAFLLMWIVPKTIGPWVTELAESTGGFIWIQLAKLFPDDITLNIMTLSGLTVAIGRVVDDSIVVLENSYRYIQKGDDPFDAVRKGTKEVAVAIFAATVTTMAVFLPLGFVGGLISAFFLPFGLTVTYALVASYIVSITVVPALTYLFIRRENIPEEQESWMQRVYTPILKWTLNNRIVTMLVALAIFAGSLFLLVQLPTSFIPSLGEPTVNVNVTLPQGTDIITTNDLALEFEERMESMDGIESVLTSIGVGAGFEALLGGGGVSQNVGSLTIAVDEVDDIDALAEKVRIVAEDIFGEENVVTTAAAQSGPGGGFGLIVTGDNLDDGVAADAITAINDVLPPGLVASQGFDSQEQAEGFQGMISAIGVSIILVYLIMALTFRSLVHPFTILFTLPFALVGAAIALFISNSVLGISAMMGLLMLVGVVVTNGIVLLELVQQLRDKGIPTYDALVDGGRTRLRPIWMTALTAILALIPLAFSSQSGAIIASELGRAVMGGLIVSTALTLIVIPVVYSLFDSVLRGGEQRKMHELARRHGYRMMNGRQGSGD